MGMSTYIIGFKPPNLKWKQMKDIYDACTKAEIEIPEVVSVYFNYEEPDPAGVEVNLDTKIWEGEHDKGWEVDLSTIDKDVKIIRFYNSY